MSKPKPLQVLLDDERKRKLQLLAINESLRLQQSFTMSDWLRRAIDRAPNPKGLKK